MEAPACTRESLCAKAHSGAFVAFQITFEVNYEKSLSEHNRDMSIASGVLAALAVVYAGYLAANWNRRHGKVCLVQITPFQ